VGSERTRRPAVPQTNGVVSSSRSIIYEVPAVARAAGTYIGAFNRDRFSMAELRLLQRVRRLSFLDGLTVLVLGIALFLFVRPGSALHASATRWLDERSTRAAVDEHWDQLTALATPLYTGDGKPDVIEFSDYECPFCRAASPAVDSAVAAGLRVGLIHLPLRIHPNARPAALAALCAHRQGAFPDVHRYFFTNSEWQTDTSRITNLEVRDLGTDPAFTACLTSDTTRTALSRHLELAERLQIDATPRFVSRQKTLSGPPTSRNLLELVDRD